jgi:hypothetical protein
VRKEDYVLPWLRRMLRKNACGVYFIFKSMEVGPTFRITVPKYPTKDPNYRILANQWSRFTHYYFYIHDELPWREGPTAEVLKNPFNRPCDGSDRSNEPVSVHMARTAEPGRGREANVPWNIPWQGWKDIIWHMANLPTDWRGPVACMVRGDRLARPIAGRSEPVSELLCALWLGTLSHSKIRSGHGQG